MSSDPFQSPNSFRFDYWDPASDFNPLFDFHEPTEADDFETSAPFVDCSLPECGVCGAEMLTWVTAWNCGMYCSAKCVEDGRPTCECCSGAIAGSYVVSKDGFFCSELCAATEQNCISLVPNDCRPDLDAAQLAGLGLAAVKTSETYVRQVSFRAGLHTKENGQTVQTGHGIAVEHASNLYDEIKGKDVQHVGSNNAKHGPDRIVNGQVIQTKYIKTPRGCVASCFDRKNNGTFKYVGKDGQPMQIEVPFEHYDKAVELMKTKISEGKIPGISDPARAKEIVRQGIFTHEQAKNLVRFGRIESVSYDAINGMRIGGVVGSVSALLTFAVSVWQGQEIKIALKQATRAGLQVFSSSFASHLVVSQIGRTGAEQSLRGASNLVVEGLGPRTCSFLSEFAGKQGLRGVAAQKYLAKALRGNAITAVVVTLVLSVKDIYRLLDRRISFSQAVKNVTTTGASVAGGMAGASAGGAAGASAGAATGAAIGSIVPVIGTGAGAAIGGTIGWTVGALAGGAAGGAAAGAATNAVMGLIIEDDAVALSKEFQQVASEIANSFVLSEEEVDSLAREIGKFDLAEFLRNMYASGNRRALVASRIKPLIVSIVAKRPAIKEPSLSELLTSLEDVLVEAGA